MPVVGIYWMGFVIIVSGAVVLGMAVAYAIRPTERKLALMRPLSLAAIFAAICSFSGGVATVFNGIAATPGWSPNAPGMAMAGLAECFIPLFVAFAFLALAWLLVALGMRRQA
jgi:hypothetical protein